MPTEQQPRGSRRYALYFAKSGSCEKESTSFLKKRSKKLLFIGLSGTTGARARVQKFFASFFQKRRSSFKQP
jgi:hypothetical protein